METKTANRSIVVDCFLEAVIAAQLDIHCAVVGSSKSPEQTFPWQLSDIDLVTGGIDTREDPFQIGTLITITEIMNQALMRHRGSFVFTTFRQETAMPELLTPGVAIGTPVHWLHYPTPADLLREPESLARNLLSNAQTKLAVQAGMFIRGERVLHPFLGAIMGPRLFLDETFRLVFANPWISESFRRREAAQKIQYSVRWAIATFLEVTEAVKADNWSEILARKEHLPERAKVILSQVIEMRTSQQIPPLETLGSMFPLALWAFTDLFIEVQRRSL